MIHKMDQNGGISMGFHIIRSKSQDVILTFFFIQLTSFSIFNIFR